MTSEEILALPAGAELDRLVLEKVMGWRVTIGESSHKGQVIAWPLPDGSGINLSPSTRIADAWLVVEPWHQRGWFMWKDGGGFTVRLMKDGTWPFEPEGEAETLPLAICRAALLSTLEDS